jgi:hypothetical protein
MGDDDPAHLPRFGDFPHFFPECPETVGSEVARRQHGPVLDAVGTDSIQTSGKAHQRFTTVSRHIAPRGPVTLHRDSAAGEEEVDHSARTA